VHLPVKEIIIFATPAVELVRESVDSLEVVGSEARYAAKELCVPEQPATRTDTTGKHNVT